jgi:DNA-binding response OmpR family regulator
MTRILVIEDEVGIRSNTIELLEAEDYEVMGAENGLIGAIGAQEFLPDLIICDVQMPELNGYDVLSVVRENPLTATIPFIFLTAYADRGDIRRGMEMGADDYLTKPFTRAELLKAIATRLAKRQTIEQIYDRQQHQNVEALQRKIRELQQDLQGKDELLKQMQAEIKNALPKMNMAIKMLKKLPPGEARDRCLKILQDTCNDEIALLNQMPDLHNFLDLEDPHLWQQLSKSVGV